MKYFPDIMDYNFTANVEKDFDDIAEGKMQWKTMIKEFDKKFEPVVARSMKSQEEHKAGERQLGVDPESGKPIFVKIGKFGPIAQMGTAEDKDKPRFVQIPPTKSIETITFDEVMLLFRLPRTIGSYEGADLVIGAGKFGPYVMHNKKYYSIPSDLDPYTITADEAIHLIMEKRTTEAKRHLKQFKEDDKLEVMNGRYGAYIVYDGTNYKLPKKMAERAKELTFEECMDIVKNPPYPPKDKKTKKKK